METFITSIGAAFPVERSVDYLRRLSTLDRFQASDGIMTAADLVADALTACGLSDVQVHRYVCPSNWWNFEGPVSWTPQHARLRLGGDAGLVIVCYPDDPMCLATYSCPTDRGGIRAPLVLFDQVRQCEPMAGRVLLIDTRTSTLQEGIAAAECGGAAGIIANPLKGMLPGARGRIELAAHTQLFGFSVTSEEYEQLERAARVGAHVDATVSIHRRASMPLVEASIPGKESQSEILIQAHLCHPAPGANDNCSGVAAALGLAAALTSLPEMTAFGPRRRGIRFLFGPEFVGTVAYLHDFVSTARRPRPLVAINLDMVGEDQAKCGGPLTIELPPDHLPSPLGALTEHCLSLLPSDTNSYSGAVSVRNWSAVVVPFVGASDHGAHADRSVAIPSILIGHWPDRFNHTSFDSLDKVSPESLRRAATIAGACALTLSVAHEGMHESLSLIVIQHALQRLLTIAKLPPGSTSGARVFSPSAAACRAEFMDVVAEGGKQQLAALESLTGGKSPHGRHVIDRQKALLCGLFDLRPRSRSQVVPGSALARLWQGPFNVRGLMEHATGPCAERIRQRMWVDKSAYAVVLALALAIDDRSSRAKVIHRAAYCSMLDIDLAFADDVFDAMIVVGWVCEQGTESVDPRL
ncbi:MAG: hypothetical protein QOJ84_3500 [Bradyrhizobium sp.]|nr:hypothetical protein [Bradyrhizobium sp.]